MKVFEQFGVKLPHGSESLTSCGKLVCRKYNETLLQPGDIICYPKHCAIYIGDGKIVHAANDKDGIKISKVTYRDDIICVRRIVYGHSSCNISNEDYEALCRIVEAEAGIEVLQCKIYVADVILNRVNSSKFSQSTIQDVIFTPGQFQPVGNERFYQVTVSKESKKAVDYAISHSDSSQGTLYFMNPDYSDPKNVNWFYSSLTYLYGYADTLFFQ